MRVAQADISRLTEELCELDPIALDRFCLEYPEPLPMHHRNPENMRYAASVILRDYSLGDALARVWRYDNARGEQC